MPEVFAQSWGAVGAWGEANAAALSVEGEATIELPQSTKRQLDPPPPRSDIAASTSVVVSRHFVGDNWPTSATPSTRFRLAAPPSAVPPATMVNDRPQSAIPLPGRLPVLRKAWRRTREALAKTAATCLVRAVNYRLGDTILEICKGDITARDVDGIVNAANSSLLGGGGVDGAIHRAGGPAILDACRAIRARQGKCATGEAVITIGGNLPARWVIHTVGPVWNGGHGAEHQLLASAYRKSLELAVSNELRSVAFPAISTGAYRFPLEDAARISIETIATFCASNPNALDRIEMVLFSTEHLECYERAARDRFDRPSSP